MGEPREPARQCGRARTHSIAAAQADDVDTITGPYEDGEHCECEQCGVEGKRSEHAARDERKGDEECDGLSGRCEGYVDGGWQAHGWMTPCAGREPHRLDGLGR